MSNTIILYDLVEAVRWDKDAGTRLRSFRDREKLTRRQLVELAEGKVSRPFVESLEYGLHNSVSREKLDIIMMALGIGVGDLFPIAVTKLYKNGG